MATVTGFTAERMLEIEETTIVDGHLDGDDLILVMRNGTEINAGSVRGIPGPIGPSADIGDVKSSIRSSIPGWLPMDGVSIPNAETLYPGLWAVAPASWKSGSTLTPPDMTETIVQGGGTVGAVTGANERVIAAANLPPHAHAGPIHTHLAPAHVHTMAHTHGMSHWHHMANHQHTISHTHAQAITHAGGIHSHPSSGPGNFIGESSGVGPLHAASGNDMAPRSIGAAGNHQHYVDVPHFSGWSSGPSVGNTDYSSISSTGASSAANTGSAGGVNTANNTPSDTGNGPGTSTPFSVQQRALRLNYFIYPGVD